MPAAKLTIDLTNINKAILQRIKAEQYIPYGATINNLVGTFCSVPDSVKKELISFIKSNILILYKNFDANSDFSNMENMKNFEAYTAIASFFNNGEPFLVSNCDEQPFLKQKANRNGFPTSKLTLDLTDKNQEILEQIKTEHQIPYGVTINNLIDIFCSIPGPVKKELLAFIKSQVLILCKKINADDSLSNIESLKSLESYTAIASFLNNGNPLFIQKSDERLLMKKISIRNGVLICPDDWIYVNPNDAANSLYACAIECQNHLQYNIPHFVFFSNIRTVFDYSEEYKRYIYRLCTSVYPRFANILKMQVAPVEDPEHPGSLLNATQYRNAPIVKPFDIYINDHLTEYFESGPIYGAQIVPLDNAK